MRRSIFLALGVSALCLAALCLLRLDILRQALGKREHQSCYAPLPEDESAGNPLTGLNADFTPKASFSTNLPIVVLHLDSVLPRYRQDREEDWEKEIPETNDLQKRWGTGTLALIDTGTGVNTLADPAIAETSLRIRRRGHSSMNYDKPQYTLKTVTAAGEENPIDILGMGAFDSWILNGSMADKSMLRNYLAYRTASEVQPETPDCRFCEVFQELDGVTTYQGVYLLLENIARGESRVNIRETKRKNVYTGYIVRRDRYNAYDTMLSTWGRLTGQCPEDQWIGVKYPGKAKQTPETLAYITQDFSRMEQVLYSKDPAVFATYDRYVDVESFCDYFLLNEFFGNYDSGEHSTIYWKDTGGKLHLGPVWDFDQAVNNVYDQEQDPETLAMTEKPFFKQLVQDKVFVERLRDRYAALRRTTLSEDHILSLLEEALAYLRSAQQREWYRWAADYLDGSGENSHNYTLAPVEFRGEILDRFNTKYDQELYVIRTYLRRHGKAIPVELKKLEASATVRTGPAGAQTLLLAVTVILLAVPALLVQRRIR